MRTIINFLRLLILTCFVLYAQSHRYKVKGVLLPKEIDEEVYCYSCLTMVDSLTSKLKYNSGEADVLDIINKKSCDNIHHGRFFPKHSSNNFWRGCMTILQNWQEQLETSLVTYTKNLYPYWWIEQDFCVEVTAACKDRLDLIKQSRQDIHKVQQADALPPKGDSQWGDQTNYKIQKKHLGKKKEL